MAINTNKAAAKINISSDAVQYILNSAELQGSTVQLNGQELQLTADDELPGLNGQKIEAGEVELPPVSIGFFTFD